MVICVSQSDLDFLLHAWVHRNHDLKAWFQSFTSLHILSALVLVIPENQDLLSFNPVVRNDFEAVGASHPHVSRCPRLGIKFGQATEDWFVFLVSRGRGPNDVWDEAK